MVHDPARGADDDGASLFQLLDLIVDRFSAVDRRDADAFFIFGKLAQFAAHLQDELAGGAEDQRAGYGLQRLCGLDGRDAERGGLSGAGI